MNHIGIFYGNNPNQVRSLWYYRLKSSQQWLYVIALTYSVSLLYVRMESSNWFWPKLLRNVPANTLCWFVFLYGKQIIIPNYHNNIFSHQ